MKAEVIRDALCVVLGDNLRQIARASPTARAFVEDVTGLSPGVLVRHTIEHVFRIRMLRPLDVRAQQWMEHEGIHTANLWAQYARSEAVHDRYFLRDLSAMGVDRAAVDAMSPFRATVRLGAFLDRAIPSYGALPVVLYSFWAEENSDVGSTAVIAHQRAIFGDGAARGASAHRGLDEHLDHADVIARVLAAIVRDEQHLVVASSLLEVITNLLGAYFCELDTWARSSSVRRPRRAATRVAALPA